MDARASARNSAHSPRNGACTTHSGPEPTWYTGPTCARSVAMNVPFSPSHSFTLLSKEADNTKRPFGEKHTWRAEEGGGSCWADTQAPYCGRRTVWGHSSTATS